jgi:hypothetical protein
MMKRTTVLRVLVVTILAALPAQLASAEDARSAPLVKQLAALMAERQLDSLAAKDPQDPGRYVAALLFPGVQLLLVSAQYPVGAEIDAQLAQRNYRDVYAALQQPVSAPSRVFFLDLGCDGLRNGGDNTDVMYEKGTAQTLFDGNWRKQGLSENAYVQKLQQSDERYAQLLTVLVQSLKSAQ